MPRASKMVHLILAQVSLNRETSSATMPPHLYPVEMRDNIHKMSYAVALWQFAMGAIKNNTEKETHVHLYTHIYKATHTRDMHNNCI